MPRRRSPLALILLLAVLLTSACETNVAKKASTPLPLPAAIARCHACTDAASAQHQAGAPARLDPPISFRGDSN